MAIQKFNPDTLPKPHGYAQVIVGTGKLVFTSGQVGIDIDEKLVGADYRSQARQTAANVYAALAAAGAEAKDMVRLMLYVVDTSEENLEQVYIGLGEAAAEVGAKATTMTLIGVAGLSVPGAVVEMDATAVLD